MSSDRESEVILDTHVHLFSEDRDAFPLAPGGPPCRLHRGAPTR